MMPMEAEQPLHGTLSYPSVDPDDPMGGMAGPPTEVNPPEDPPTEPFASIGVPEEPPSLARASGSMVIANLVSRITGFLRQVMLVGVLGIGTIPDSYNLANTLPNIVYELLMGAVLASAVIPVLVRAQHEDADDGREFTQRLVTVAGVLLLAGTIIAVACAPLLTRLYFSGNDPHRTALTTAFSYLLLPQILFYGVFGLLSGILNARQVFKPAAWATVLFNLVMFVTLAVYLVLPGDISLNPVRMGDAKLLVLGIGTTLGVAIQAAILIPPLLRIGFRFRWRWGWDHRLGQFSRMVFWLVLYTLVSQVAYVVLSKIATGAQTGSYTVYSNSWLLLQVPYGVLGVSLLTAIMPRMSKAAAAGDVPGVVENLSTGSRMSAVMIIPICALITVLGPDVGIALFGLRHSNISGSAVIGLSLTTSAFGLVFYAITMLQLRVFYAMNDARTPTVINGIMVLVKVILFAVCAKVLDPGHIVYGLTFINGLGFVIAAIVGEIWLRSRIGRLDTGRVIRTLAKVTIASVWGAAAALLVGKGLAAVFPAGTLLARSWVTLVLGSLVGLPIAFGGMLLLRVSELRPVWLRIARLARRG
jgi:putative peptidoglycan lipid II flippase